MLRHRLGGSARSMCAAIIGRVGGTYLLALSGPHQELGSRFTHPPPQRWMRRCIWAG